MQLNWQTVIQTIVATVLASIIVGILGFPEKLARLEERVKRLEDSKITRDGAPENGRAEIPLNVGWKPQGSVVDNNPGGYRHGIWELNASLRGAGSYAEIFVDMRALRLRGLRQNSDGSYNLVGTELTASVTTNENFRGDPTHPNGAQFLLKDERGNNLIGTWLDVTEAMMTLPGMEVFYKVPDTALARNVAGISLKFTIGNGSANNYAGRFFVQKITITKAS